MSMETRLQLKLAQKLIMNQNLQLAIKLLQMNKMELEAEINRELLENPVLELSEIDEDLSGAPHSITDYQSISKVREANVRMEPEESQPALSNDPALQDFDWDQFLDDNPESVDFNNHEDREFVSQENFLASPGPTLSEHLLWQLSMSRVAPEVTQAAVEIIAAIDDDGYLTLSIEEIAAKNRFDLEVAEAALRHVQEFDPLGVGARDPRECLLLQIKQTEFQGTIVEDIIKGFLHYLERNAYPEIAKALSVNVDEVKVAVEVIHRLEPKPGRSFLPRSTQYITPDVYIVKVDDDYKILLNDEGIPRLRISSLYRSILYQKSKTPEKIRRYVEKKCRDALWLIKSIDQRQRTIYKVSECILRLQRDFFDNGIGSLKPLILKDVADDIEMSESTVSRVSTNKYIHTPQGLYEIKFFFHGRLETNVGDSISSLRVKDMLRSLIEKENPKDPLSDADVEKELNRRGIMIKRRTVAKYREELKIPTSSRRKTF